MDSRMRVSVTFDKEFPDLPQRLADARKRCPKAVSQICGEAGISSTFWYQVVRGEAKGISLDTLRALENALETDLGISESDILK